MKLVIYYKNPTINSLVIKNSNYAPTPALQQTNLVYEYQCNQDDCERLHNSSYVGLTTCTLSRRLTQHLQSGGPKQHSTSVHNNPINRETLVNNTKIIRRESDPVRLSIYEALLILQKKPMINEQVTCFNRTLKLFHSALPSNYRNNPRESIRTNRVPLPITNRSPLLSPIAQTTANEPIATRDIEEQQVQSPLLSPIAQTTTNEAIPARDIEEQQVPVRRSARIRASNATRNLDLPSTASRQPGRLESAIDDLLRSARSRLTGIN